MQIIDAHQHFWQIDRGIYDWIRPDNALLYRDYVPEDLAPLLREAGVDRTVHVQASWNMAENDWILEQLDRWDFLAGMVGIVDLTADDVDATLARWADDPRFCGVRCNVPDDATAAGVVREDLSRGLAVLSRRELSLDLLLTARKLPHAAAIARAFPELRIVIDHIGVPSIKDGWDDAWARDLTDAARQPNVHCKVSGMVTVAGDDWTPDRLKPWVDHVVECFGPRRLMFGSDWPVCLRGGSYEQVLDAAKQTLGGLSEAEQAWAFAETARAFYRLRA